MGKTEKQGDNLALEVRQRTALSIVIGQFQGFTERCPGDIRQLEYWLLGLATASCQGNQQSGEQRRNKGSHRDQNSNCR